MEQRQFLSAGAVGRNALTKDGIRSVLGQSRGERSDVATNMRLAAEQGERAEIPTPKDPLTPAAVLVPLVMHGGGWTVLLTQRTPHLIHHGGQISFPGGRLEPDDSSPEAAALRETEEETGVNSDRFELLGRLDDYVTVTGFHVVPVVGVIEPPFTLRPDPFEVAEVFEVPLAYIMDPANHQHRSRLTDQGLRRWFYAIDWQGKVIWGATAAMLVNLQDRLAGLP